LPSNVARYTLILVIRSFRCADTQTLFETGKCKRFSGIANIAVRKLAQLDAAETLAFLRSPPGNRLEALKGDRRGQCSIRVNDQFRVCFRWTDEGPEDVEIVDYH
jgi:proteic killer suppression protein